jgi:hypothetical protein
LAEFGAGRAEMKYFGLVLVAGVVSFAPVLLCVLAMGTDSLGAVPGAANLMAPGFVVFVGVFASILCILYFTVGRGRRPAAPGPTPAPPPPTPARMPSPTGARPWQRPSDWLPGGPPPPP